MRLRGVYTPIVTPFDNNDNVDYAVLELVIDHVLDGGVAGVIPCGTTGEYYALNTEERTEVMRFVQKTVGDRAELIAGTNGTATRDIISFNKLAKDLGYKAVMLAPPFYSLPTQEELRKHFNMLLDAVDIPIVLYNFPARAGVEIGMDVLLQLAAHENVIGVKESSGDFARFLQMISAITDHSLIVAGSDDQAFDYFAWGVQCWIAGASSVAPRQHVDVLEAALDGDLIQSRECMRKILPLLQNMESGKYNQKAKYGCELAGISVGNTRAPLMPLSNEEKQEFAKVYDIAVASNVEAIKKAS
ncbi:MAG: 4-hydroxy-tetrahydrodipicolinate synthase [Gammaproteobacteria bacterium]|nr:4-hydroxy-tetrahydrodipicolinate synthase [Gammaproteobacteria bacterium]